MKNLHRNEHGSHVILVAVAVIAVALIGFAGYRVSQRDRDPVTEKPVNLQPSESEKETLESDVTWSFDGSMWKAVGGTPPDCPDPLALGTPIDLSKVESILYPGQVRGEYKPHGGFRMAGANPSHQVVAPLSGKVVHGSRYIESGEVQYLFTIVNPCGIAYRFDHLFALSPAFQKIADGLPAAKPDDSRTTNFSDPVKIEKGDVIATGVGHPATGNIGFDWGVYDYRGRNPASQTAGYEQKAGRIKEQSFYAVCWFDLLAAADEAKVRALPAGDQAMGKTSDYCK